LHMYVLPTKQELAQRLQVFPGNQRLDFEFMCATDPLLLLNAS